MAVNLKKPSSGGYTETSGLDVGYRAVELVTKRVRGCDCDLLGLALPN